MYKRVRMCLDQKMLIPRRSGGLKAIPRLIPMAGLQAVLSFLKDWSIQVGKETSSWPNTRMLVERSAM